jgi:hypothetical protein
MTALSLMAHNRKVCDVPTAGRHMGAPQGGELLCANRRLCAVGEIGDFLIVKFVGF